MTDLFSRIAGLVSDNGIFAGTPHGFCLNWDASLVSMTLIGNIMTFIAYVWIPSQLMFMYFQSKNEQWTFTQHGVVRVFCSLFILSCGVHHLWNAITLFKPYYETMAIIDLFTGFISLVSASAIQLAVQRRPKAEPGDTIATA